MNVFHCFHIAWNDVNEQSLDINCVETSCSHSKQSKQDAASRRFISFRKTCSSTMCNEEIKKHKFTVSAGTTHMVPLWQRLKLKYVWMSSRGNPAQFQPWKVWLYIYEQCIVVQVCNWTANSLLRNQWPLWFNKISCSFYNNKSTNVFKKKQFLYIFGTDTDFKASTSNPVHRQMKFVNHDVEVTQRK